MLLSTMYAVIPNGTDNILAKEWASTRIGAVAFPASGD